jgi:hypothetical protein
VSWLRLDDGFAENDKIGALTDREFRTWVEVLLYCARTRSGGFVPAKVRSIPGLTTAFIGRALELELLEERPAEEDSAGAELTLHVHDWQEYNGPLETSARRQKRYRMKNAGVAPEIIREVAPLADDLAQGDDIPWERYVSNPVTRYVSSDVQPTRAVSPTPTPRDVNPLTEQQLVHARERRARSGYVENLSQYTGCRIARGEVGISHVYDPLGTEPAPDAWPHARPTREEIIEAFKRRGE